LQVYKDGTPFPIHFNCHQKCPSVKRLVAEVDVNKDELNDEMKNLQMSLEEEIIESEKFLASNEAIEDRSKRKSGELKNKELAAAIDKTNPKQLKRMKDLANMKFSEKEFAKELGDKCSECPSFDSGDLFELYLRLPKGLNCSEDGTTCLNEPKVEIEVALVEEQIECTGGYLAKFPSELNNMCKIDKSNVEISTKCILPTCNIDISKPNYVRKARHSGKSLMKRNVLNAGDLHRFSQKIINLPIESSKQTASCIWHINTETLKHLQLNIPSTILNYITIFESNLDKPIMDMRHCSPGYKDGYWISTKMDNIFIIYNNENAMENDEDLNIHLWLCSEPPRVDYAKVRLQYLLFDSLATFKFFFLIPLHKCF